MLTVHANEFVNNALELLKETFEGTGGQSSHYIDPTGGSLFETLEHISAEQASSHALAGSSIAAHCGHTRYYLEVLPQFMRLENPKPDWPASWRTQTVTPLEWDALRTSLRHEYEQVMAFLRGIQTWDDEMTGGTMSMLAHSAYHLGAVRQLSKVKT